MHFEAISPHTPPPAWELNEKLKPKDPANADKCARALEFFKRNPQWIASNTDIVRDYALLIAKTDFSEAKWSVSIPKIKELFMETFPDLFPSTIVIIGEVIRKMLNERLAEISPKFFKEMIDSLSWGLRKQIILVIPVGIDSETLHNFADYLSGEKEIVIHGKNVLLLLFLALENMIPELEKACSEFLWLNLNVDNLGAVVNFASSHDLGKTTDDLKSQCFRFATKHASNPVVQSLFESEDLCPEAKLILETAIANAELAKHNAGFAVEYGYQTLSLEGYSSMKIDDRVLGIIASIQKFSLPIKHLDIRIIGIDNADLEKLCDLIPNPKGVKLKNAKITELPNRWLESLKDVSFENCWFVKRLVVPNATDVDFTKCDALESIEAPQAERVFFSNCKVFVTSKVYEKTRTAIYKECEALEKVEAVNTGSMHFISCWHLQKIDAPGTKEFYFSNCPSFQEVRVAGGCYFDHPLPPNCQLTCVGEGDPKFNPCPVQ